MIKISQLIVRSMIVGAVSVIAACGGGGPSDSPGASLTSSALSGTASKGLLQNAIVTAYCGIKSNSNAIGSTTTDANGLYSLTLTGTCSLPVQVVVTAGPNTTMLDEIAGQILAPSNFTLRAFVPNAGSNISLPVTPFTDMAAAVVENSVGSSNALSLEMVSNANSAIIVNVLGGNAGLFTAQPLPPTAYSDGNTTADQKQLIVLLSAISQAAQTASGATAGDKIQTVLTQLATQAKQTVPTVNSTGYSVSTKVSTSATTPETATPLATISSGLTALAASSNTSNLGSAASAIKSNVSAAQTAVIQTSNNQIATSQTTNGGSVDTPTSAVQTAIGAARTLFVKIRSNGLELANPQGTGFLNNKSTALTKDANSYVMSGTYDFTNILKAAYRGTNLLVQTNNALALGGGSPNTPAGAVASTNAFGDFYQHVWNDSADVLRFASCTAYYTAGAGITTTNPVRTAPFATNNNHPVAVCKEFIFNGSAVKEMQFVVQSPSTNPTTGTSTFNYINRIRTWASSACTNAANAKCLYTDGDVVTGALSATVDSNLAVSAMTIVNQPVIPFQGGNPTTMSLDFTASQSTSSASLLFSGALTSGTLKYSFQPGSKLVLRDKSGAAGTGGTAAILLIGQIQTGAFQYDGTFVANGTASNNEVTDGTISFGGKISTLTNGVATPFLEGDLSGDLATNVVAFSGKVTDGPKVTNLSISGDASITGQVSTTVTFLTPGYSFTGSGTIYDNPATPSTITVTASDGTKIVVTRANGTSTALVKNSANTMIGTLNSAGNQVNFKDGTYIILN